MLEKSRGVYFMLYYHNSYMPDVAIIVCVYALHND